MSGRLSGSSWDNPIWYRNYRVFVDDRSGTHPVGYAFVHDDYDGAEDGNDHRHGWAPTLQQALREIDDQVAEAVEEIPASEMLQKLVDEFSCSLEMLERHGPDLTCAEGEFISASVLSDRAHLIKRARSALASALEARRGETRSGSTGEASDIATGNARDAQSFPGDPS